MTSVVDVTDAQGNIVAPDWLRKAEPVHRQLRPHMAKDYVAAMRRVFAGGGRMCVAARGGEVAGVAVYRIYENTWNGLKMYVDDLVTDEERRSSGIGHALMEHLQAIAREAGCTSFSLDSGTHRHQAHKFYFREGMTIPAFHFIKPLK